MKKNQVKPTDAAELRRRAEDRLRERHKTQRSEVRGRRSEGDSQRLLHELQVHQIELEMQNEELHRAHAGLESLLTKYTALYDFAPTGYFTLDREGTIHGLNLAGASLVGIERSKLIGQRFTLFVAAETRPAFTAFLRKAFESGTKGVCETSLQQERNPPRWVWIEACGDVSGKECRLAVTDITGRKQAETERVRLERQVHAASEREQRRIGESLHEDLCQRLAGIGIAAAAMAKTLKAKARPESDQASGLAGELHECLHQARHFANILQPVSLLEEGFVTAINSLVLHTRKRSGIRCHFKGEDLPELPAADATHLYRIAQEALDNSVQHAKASRIDIVLSKSHRDITLTIADDGLGRADTAGQDPGLGLQIMRYRSDVLGATLTIESKPGGGTVVTCRYPVAGKEPAWKLMKTPSTHPRLPRGWPASGNGFQRDGETHYRGW